MSKSTKERKGSSQDRQDMMTRRNSILIIILSVVIIVATIGGIIVNLGNKSGSQSQGSADKTAESNISVAENSNDLEENKHEDVNALIANYRKAFKEGDAELLKKVYNSDQEVNTEVLTATTAIIEDYLNTQYYTKRGLNTGEYVVFVYDELKLADIETLAPNLSVFYVKPTADGTLYIDRGQYNSATGAYNYDEATQNYINQLYQDEDVNNLIATVNTRMDSACAKDNALMEFMQKVRNRTNVDTASESETAESESETETDSETTQE